MTQNLVQCYTVHSLWSLTDSEEHIHSKLHGILVSAIMA